MTDSLMLTNHFYKETEGAMLAIPSPSADRQCCYPSRLEQKAKLILLNTFSLSLKWKKNAFKSSIKTKWAHPPELLCQFSASQLCLLLFLFYIIVSLPSYSHHFFFFLECGAGCVWVGRQCLLGHFEDGRNSLRLGKWCSRSENLSCLSLPFSHRQGFWSWVPAVRRK